MDVDTWYDESLTWNESYFYNFKNYLNGLQSGEVLEKKEACYFINAYNKEFKTWENNQCIETCTWVWEVSYTWEVFTESENWFKLKSLIENSKWWVWPFVTMYSSILNYQELVMNPDSWSVMWTLFWLIINTFFALILFIPVAVLMVLLIIRIWFLWIVVAISPVLILVNFGPLPDKVKSNDIFKKFKIEEIIKQIFLPVVVVFAVSLCIVFLSAIYKSKPNYDDASQTLSAFWIEKVGTSEVQSTGCAMAWKNMTRETYSILWLVTVNINAQNYNHGKDIFVWVLMELLATWIVWFFMKFAITAMSDRWKKLMSTADKFVTTLPLIQLPGVEWKVWLHALGIGEWNQDKMINNLDSKVRQLTNADAQDEALRRRFEGDNPTSSSDSGSSPSIAEAISYIQRNRNVTFGSLSEGYQDALKSVWYNENNFDAFATAVRADNYKNLLNENISGQGSSQWHTNNEAVMYTRAQLDAAVRTDSKWRTWASGMVAWSVQTSDWVFIVDYLGGQPNTWNPGNQQYEIVDRETYESRHFQVSSGMQTITKDDYEKYTSDQQKQLERHFKEIEEELKKLEELSNKSNLTPDEEKELESLRNTQNGIATFGFDLQQLRDKMKEFGIQ